ncbi:hypothetical protein BCD01_000897 [Escherichia coli]|nr:hypothetical protein [Escherichia coli]
MNINWKVISISTLLWQLHAAAAPHQEKEHRSDAFSSATQKSDSLITAKAELINGKWFINGKYRPVLKTSMTKTNFLEIMNVANKESLFIVIPKLEYKIIAKNKIILNEKIALSEDTSGKRIVWIEPKSSITLSFINDLANTPLQAIVSITRNKKDVIAIFGPDQGKGFTLPGKTSDEQKSVPDYSDLNLNKFIIPQSVGNPVIINPKEKNYHLSGQVKYEILSLPKYQHLEFSEPVYIEKRTDILGGYGYWTKETILYPGESLSFVTSAKNNLRKRDD